MYIAFSLLVSAHVIIVNFEHLEHRPLDLVCRLEMSALSSMVFFSTVTHKKSLKNIQKLAFLGIVYCAHASDCSFLTSCSPWAK